MTNQECGFATNRQGRRLD